MHIMLYQHSTYSTVQYSKTKVERSETEVLQVAPESLWYVMVKHITAMTWHNTDKHVHNGP